MTSFALKFFLEKSDRALVIGSIRISAISVRSDSTIVSIKLIVIVVSGCLCKVDCEVVPCGTMGLSAELDVVLNRNGSFYRWMGLIIHDLKVFELVIEDGVWLSSDVQLGKWIGHATQLKSSLL